MPQMPEVATDVPHHTQGPITWPQKLEQRAMLSKLSTGSVSRPLAGLPIRRFIPQDVHSAMDYLNGASVFAAGLSSRSGGAKAAGALLGLSLLGVSLLTDYRWSAAKLVPIEVHEGVDHLWGLATVLSPFLFGYWRKAPLATTVQVACGLGTVLASLFTDYRCVRQVRWSYTPLP